MNEHEFEPVRGLPETLPEGEQILWQGAPDWRALALSAFHLRTLAVYFGAMLALRGVSAAAGGASMPDAFLSGVRLAPLALAALALLALFAWLVARTTVYTVTNRRVVMRFGIALPMTVNVPFPIIEAAALRADTGGCGDIPLELTGGDRIAYVQLWPHARPWRFARPEPMLRALPDAARVGAILAQSLAGGTPAPMTAGAAAGAPEHDVATRPLAAA